MGYAEYQAAERAQAGDETQAHRIAIYGALLLYLDFINLFLPLLGVLGAAAVDGSRGASG